MGKSPFELVAGCNPQGLSDATFKKLGGKGITPAGYVATLQEYLQKIHSLVRTQLQGGHLEEATCFRTIGNYEANAV